MAKFGKYQKPKHAGQWNSGQAGEEKRPSYEGVEMCMGGTWRTGRRGKDGVRRRPKGRFEEGTGGAGKGSERRMEQANRHPIGG